jgi:hypothetical protein
MKVNLECTPDEMLVKCLGVVRKNIEHHNDKGKVCNHLQKNGISGEIALIDEDPGSGQPKYLREKVTSVEEIYSLKIFKDSERNHLIILVRPRLEGWVLQIAKQSKIKPKDFGLPDDDDELHGVILDNLNKFKSLVEKLLSENNESIIYLQTLLNQSWCCKK